MYYLPGDRELSLVSGLVLGALSLMALNATCSLHGGVIQDNETSRESQMYEIYHSSYYYIQVSQI